MKQIQNDTSDMTTLEKRIAIPVTSFAPKTTNPYVDSNFANMSFRINDLDSIFFKNYLSRSSPSDIIKLTRESDTELMLIARKSYVKYGNSVNIPSDLFFAGTVPLIDCRIVIDEKGIGGSILSYRAFVFPDYQSIIKKNSEFESAITVGGFIVDSPVNNKTPIYVTLMVRNGSNMIETGSSIGNPNKDDIAKLIAGLLATWYGVQFAMLHPIIKEIYRQPKQVAVTVNNQKKFKKKNHNNRVKYIKQHVISVEDISNATKTENGRIRHTMIWYTIGHWRTYKNGKKVFIQPCWKGPLKELKKTEIERERLIAQKDESEQL